MTQIQAIESSANGIIIVQLVKDDGGLHRFSVEPGADFSGNVLPAINADLLSQGMSALSDDMIAAIAAQISEIQTADIIAAYIAPRLAAAAAAAEPAALLAAAQDARASAYRAESDPLGMKAQRLAWLSDPGAAAAQKAYLDKVTEIQARFPYPPAV